MGTPLSAGRRSTIVAAALALALAGCSSSGDTGDTGDTGLTFMNQSRGQEAALTRLAQQYTKKTGVKITIDTPGPADYLPKLQAKAQSRSMPDIYSSFDASQMAPFYKAGWAMDLSAQLNAGWSKNFSPAVLKMSTFQEGNNLGVKPGVYSVHWETQTYGFLINPALTGIEKPPATTTEFIDALAAKKAKFAIAASQTPNIVQALASNWLTDAEIEATLNGKASWKQDGWGNAFQFLADVKKAGVLADDSIPGGQDDHPNVESSFFTKSMGAIFDAAPGIAVGLRTNPEFEDYFSTGVPKAPGSVHDPRSPGVPGKGAVINPRSEQSGKALAFVKWLTEPEQQAVFAKTARILPSNPELLAGADIPGQLAGFAAGVKGMQVMSTTFTPDVITAIRAESQRLVLGEATVDEVLTNVQAAQDRTS
ncbi:ABC-type glycerol-3-phosphate transport system, substrate-binding protein [Nonomuraea solani]|uniref:ABC-type glycerol-3-phosphate transport system, substrate-binding protein n=1 Tax=Nonomuraea solani TaxID=1144553 RepID=A0A1H6F3Y7_9ACTN|nr:extracellular solute-binding protein [Nonomuraea solani]SEH03674.1 ABC-type glycerol-3-phosphate transport system, substrate-binding protein [Nonomuraea solani]